MFYKFPFGYSTLNVGNHLTLFTGKIRVKTSADDLRSLLSHCAEVRIETGSNNCSIITFVTTSATVNDRIIKDINSILCDLMHKRIDAKYNRFSEPVVIGYIDELPY
jgi:hypothetical protein